MKYSKPNRASNKCSSSAWLHSIAPIPGTHSSPLASHSPSTFCTWLIWTDSDLKSALSLKRFLQETSLLLQCCPYFIPFLGWEEKTVGSCPYMLTYLGSAGVLSFQVLGGCLCVCLFNSAAKKKKIKQSLFVWAQRNFELVHFVWKWLNTTIALSPFRHWLICSTSYWKKKKATQNCGILLKSQPLHWASFSDSLALL